MMVFYKPVNFCEEYLAYVGLRIVNQVVSDGPGNKAYILHASL